VRVLAVYGQAYLSYRTAAIVRTIRDERSRCTVLDLDRRAGGFRALRA
jgi:hypothetical protein